MRLVHLSDIHFGGYGSGWDANEDQRYELLRDLQRLVEIHGSVDGVLVGGDVAYRASPDEYAIASKWLDEVCNVGGCPPSRVWTVPGNHDIDRPMHLASQVRIALRERVKELVHSGQFDQLDDLLSDWLMRDPGAEAHFACLEAYNNFARGYGCATTAASPMWSDGILDLDGIRVVLTGLNSVITSDTSDSSAADSQDPDLGLVVGRRQSELKRADGALHLAFMHHPPAWLGDWNHVSPYLRRAHLLLFGHEHRYAVQQDPGGTIQIHAGAVGPHHGGQDGYVPSWNLISLEKAGDVIRVSNYPRIWLPAGTCFGQHPEGSATRQVPIDLGRVTEPSEPAGNDQQKDYDEEAMMGDATSATPLLPDFDDDDGDEEQPGADERSRLRALTVGFLRLTRTQQQDLAMRLELADGLPDVSRSQVGVEILKRVREANKVDELEEKMRDA